MSIVYGGDEVSAIVVDFGTSNLRAGWAGEDTPRCIFPTKYAYVPDEHEGQPQPAPATPEDVTKSVFRPTLPAGEAMEGVEGPADQGTEPAATEEAEPKDEHPPQDPSTSEGAGKEAGQEGAQEAETPPTDPRVAARRAKWQDKLYGEKRRRYVGDFGANSYRPDVEVASPLDEEGILQSVPALFAEIDFALRDQMHIDPTTTPLLVTEPSWTTKKAREEMMELAFEGLGVPAFYLANSAVMSAFAAGKPTALVVDVGEWGTSATPVLDGFVLHKNVRRQPIGGKTVSKALHYALQHPSADSPRAERPVSEITPQYLIKRKMAVELGRPAQVELYEDRKEHGTDSFKEYQTARVLDDFKEAYAQVPESSVDATHNSTRPRKTFEFPDGTSDEFGSERFDAAEVLFNPSLWTSKEGVLPPAPEQGWKGVAELVLDAISSADVDVRAALYANVVCVGGTTLLPGFADRLSYELGVKATGQKVKLHSPGNVVERKCASWLGGSMLASLGTFHQLWVSRQEWEEYGNALVHIRCK